MKSTKFVALLLVFLPLAPTSLGSYQKLATSNGLFLCAADSPAMVFPNEAISSVPTCVPSSVLCSWKCYKEPSCIGYNVNLEENQCQLYDSTPNNFVINTTCEYFQDKSYNGTCPPAEAPPNTAVVKLVPELCCSFPFTLNGVIYYNCTQRTASLFPNSLGCFMANRIWAYCLSPTGFTADYYNGSVIVPNNTQPVASVFIYGWFIIQKHIVDGNMLFNKTWSFYKKGFGDPGGEHFWFGNENLYRLTSTGKWKLRVEVESNDTGKWYSAEYNFFQLSNEASFYVLNVSGYTGDAGDSLNHPNTGYRAVGMKFSTVDKDQDATGSSNCALSASGGWWWNYCGVSGLNAQNFGYNAGYNSWGTLPTTTRFVSRSRMMMKRN